MCMCIVCLCWTKKKPNGTENMFYAFTMGECVCVCVCVICTIPTTNVKLAQNNSYSVRLIIFEGDLSEKVIKNQLEKIAFFPASLVTVVEFMYSPLSNYVSISSTCEFIAVNTVSNQNGLAFSLI